VRTRLVATTGSHPAVRLKQDRRTLRNSGQLTQVTNALPDLLDHVEGQRSKVLTPDGSVTTFELRFKRVHGPRQGVKHGINVRLDRGGF
ncbi:hypothetical protein AB0D86_50010, partial [Streptomyces sp. NPDC048324]|uniref:hypothetical protein n=1 Tax=Streptomyces sp. NPDC048324 TaxID=3157205 RepID=UPI0034220A65